jgi:gallate 1-beta-glucosyltransferase
MPSQPHVLLVSFPLQGHVNPILRLGRRLAAKGLLVTVTTFRHAGLRALRDDDCACPGGGRLRFEYLEDPCCYHLDDPTELLCHVADVGPAALAGLVRRQADPVACVVNNPFTPWALDVAGAMGVPCRAMLWIQSCAVLSLYYHFYDNSFPEAFPSEADPDRPVALPGLPTVAADELPFMVRREHARTVWGDILRAQLRQVKEKTLVSWVLVNTFHGLERPAVDVLRAHVPSIAPVGPLLEQDVHDGEITAVAAEDDDGNGCMAWLDAQPPGSVVYVAFGSLVNIGCGEMKAVAAGLLATGRPFLWVVRDDSRGLLPGDVLAACIDNKGNNKIVAWCPQDRVLGHGAVGCFVTHCGWNSVTEALACGVPVVGYPWWSDQFTNSKFLVDEYRVGVRLPAPVTRDALRACVDDVMSGPKADMFRVNAAAWKKEAEAAVADGGSSDRNLEGFVADVRSVVIPVSRKRNEVDG